MKCIAWLGQACLFRNPTLFPIGFFGQTVRLGQLASLQKRGFLFIPLWSSFAKCKQGTQETSGSCVFVKSTDKVGDGRFKFGIQNNGRVNQHVAGSVANFFRLRVGHAFEHLEFDTTGDVALFPQDHRKRDIEKVVAADSDSDGLGVFRGELQTPTFV